jgi:hypothetical protein
MFDANVDHEGGRRHRGIAAQILADLGDGTGEYVYQVARNAMSDDEERR